MKKFECLVKRGKITEKIIRYFTDEERAFLWLELEGYKIIRLLDLDNDEIAERNEE